MRLLMFVSDLVRRSDLRARLVSGPLSERVRFMRESYLLSDREVGLMLAEDQAAIAAYVAGEITAIDPANLGSVPEAPAETGVSTEPSLGEDERAVAWPGVLSAGVEAVHPSRLPVGVETAIQVVVWHREPGFVLRASRWGATVPVVEVDVRREAGSYKSLVTARVTLPEAGAYDLEVARPGDEVDASNSLSGGLVAE